MDFFLVQAFDLCDYLTSWSFSLWSFWFPFVPNFIVSRSCVALTYETHFIWHTGKILFRNLKGKDNIWYERDELWDELFFFIAMVHVVILVLFVMHMPYMIPGIIIWKYWGNKERSILSKVLCKIVSDWLCSCQHIFSVAFQSWSGIIVKVSLDHLLEHGLGSGISIWTGSCSLIPPNMVLFCNLFWEYNKWRCLIFYQPIVL